MKKLLALFLAVALLAAGSVGAMAADVPVEIVYLTPFAITLRVGDIKVLTAEIYPSNATNKNIVWSSSDSAVARVDRDGSVTGVSAGRATIRATSVDGNHWNECSVTVTNEYAQPIMVNGKRPGETLKMTIEISNEGEQRQGYRYTCAEKIKSITFQSGLMSGMESLGRIRIQPTTPRHDIADIGTVLNDVMVVTLANGSSYSFPVEMTFTAGASLKFPANDEGLSFDDGTIPMGKTHTYIVELYDKANVVKEPITTTLEEEGNDNVVSIGQISTSGKKIFIPVTPIKVGSVSLVLIVEYQTDNGPDEANLSWIADVIPAPSGPDDNDQPTKPDKPINPDAPDKPTRPTRPDNPGGGGGPVDDDDSPAPQATENKANEEKTQNALKAGNIVEVKLSNGTAAIDLETMGILGAGKGTLTVINGRMTVDIPGGFGAFHEPGRIYFPFDYEQEPPCCSYEMNAAVKEGNRARTETVKAGGNMVMPGPVTVTLKTKLTGTVNVYHYNDYNRRFTKLAEVPVADGRVTFTTRQLGHMVLTTGTI